MKIKNILHTALITISSGILLSSCSKDRLLKEEYSSMDSFFDKNKQQEQEFTIDSLGNGPIVGKMGTKIYVNKTIFMYADGSDITYPFTIRLIEIYPIKDMIFWKLPTVAGGNVIEIAAEIRVKAFKNGVELMLKPGKKYYMELATMTKLNTNMKVYYGFSASNYIDWTNNLASIVPINDTLSSVTANGTFYAMNVAKMGWTACARPTATSLSTTTMTFTAKGGNPQNISIFVVFKNFKAVAQVYNLTLGKIPLGEQVTVVAMAMNQNNEYVLHKQEITITANQQIALDMQPINETDLLSMLGSL